MTLKIYRDPSSASNPHLFFTKHVTIDWTIDFNRQVLSGYCILHLVANETPAKSSDFIILDTREINVKNVSFEDLKLNFEFGEKNFVGQPLKISLSNIPNLDSIKELALKIEYETSRDASALQWFEPKTTLGKKYPYLFSQCQAIHARSILPCQDTPMVKFTYEASVSVQKPLTVLMSAINTGKEETSETIRHKFAQNIKIPSYLIAIVSGDLVSSDLGPISRVWTEREMIERCAWEFADVDKMVKEAESLAGEYVWGRYDILVLPPTFPYGGMENPCLTFVTPTLIAGDRSLVSVIQHEIAHSWTGNLVTNCSWEHFWLNEGFTKFLENKLVGINQKSELFRQFECIDGWRCLVEAVKDFGDKSPLTQLVCPLDQVDPDDAFSSIPYEKGHSLLFYLEQILGGTEVFNKYLRAHIERFKGLSIDTNDWKQFLYEYFSDKKEILDSVDWNAWLNTPGMPPVVLKFDETLANQVKNLTEKLTNEEIVEKETIFDKFSSDQKRELVSQLLNQEPLSCSKIDSLNKYYKFGETQNSEILFRWIRLCIKAKWEPILQPALKFVTDQGRMKFTRPVYKDLYAWNFSRQAAIDTFLKERDCMHKTTASLVAKDLNISS
ncbi:leukotriene A-4 hydrolase [Brachionus plicatilis]|uniref:Leukotriene A-4 hydrolase n=1 Tax=Brachionus plicatilis TaxID=10195 RepID=A0A3M7RZW1_BRAPC|nr:leukotriene A-4 hydrolase [Brachionus plicatilis]